MPQVPTLAEAGLAEANLTSTFGIFAPARTAPAVLAQLAAEVGRAMATPEMAERLKSLDNVPWVMNGTDFGAFIRRESAQNAKIIAAAGIKAE
jgi:tripartite-type tricarboxylate transporter receptor subunit TctC